MVRLSHRPAPSHPQCRVGPWKIDALWPHERLAVEIDGHAAHSSPRAHDRDHREEQYLISAGYATRRVTALQAIDEPALGDRRHRAAQAQKR